LSRFFLEITMRLPAFLLLSLLGTLPAAASEPYLVKDINPVPQNTSSSPGEFLSLDSGISLFFAEDGGGSGPQLWRSNGSEAGTFRLIDEDYAASVLTKASDRAFFWVRVPDPPDPAADLWVTDGSKAGTFPLTANVSLAGQPPAWIESRGLLFFTATEETRGLELWRTDGTPAGTWMVKDIAPGTGSSSPAHLIEFEGRLFFQANDGMNGPALWATDGTEAGTRMVRDPWPGRADHTGPEWPQVAGSKLFFFAPAPGIGEELWVSDGTTRGTRPVADLVPGPASPQPYSWTALGNRLLLILDTGRGQELWVSDGTRAGTRALTDFEPFQAFGQFPFLSKQLLGKLLPFRVHDGVHGFELWITDGTRAGTRLVKDICPGQCSSDAGFTVFGNRLVLNANDGKRGHELWISDGTPAGTRFLRDLCPGACSSFPAPIAVLGKRLLFSAFSDAAPTEAARQLWRTDGTSRGTVRISSFELGYNNARVGLVPGAILFQAWDPEHGEELWRSNGTRPGTRLVKDINSNDVGGSSPRELRAAGSEVFFLADAPDATGEVRAGLWRSDGTAAGTRPAGSPPGCPRIVELITVLPSGLLVFTCQYLDGVGLVSASGFRITPPGVGPREVVAAGGSLFFVAQDPEEDRELWTSDGLSAARRVADLGLDTPSGRTGLTALQGRVLFQAWSVTSSGFELWVSDGTTEGTVPLTQHDAQPNLLGLHAGRLWFAADSPEYGYELWSTDGTAEGTRMMADMAPDGSFSPHRLISAGDRMFFSAGEFPDTGLWVSDGTAVGTRQIGPYPLQEEFRVSGPDAAVVGGRLFYRAVLPAGAEILWQSDGTEEGTGPVLGSGVDASGDRFYDPRYLNAFAGRLFFLWGGALWSTDGTPEGASPIPGLQWPEEPTVAGGYLFLRAYDPDHGHELWALEP
jgi:ELWxxDGT repeat protein